MLTLRRLIAATLVLGITVIGACGGDDAPATDGGGALDSGLDAGRMDAGSSDAGSTDAALADGSSADAGRSDGGSRRDAGACTPAVTDTSTIRADCAPPPDGVGCDTGYECFGFSGAALSYSCEIPCIDDCDCAAPTTCATVNDKVGPHLFCRAAP